MSQQGGGPIRAVLRMKVKSGREEEFVAAWRRVAAVAATRPGNLAQALLRDPADGSVFYVSTDWRSLAEFGAFERSPEQDELTAPLRALREEAAMTLYQIVETAEPPAQAGEV